MSRIGRIGRIANLSRQGADIALVGSLFCRVSGRRLLLGATLATLVVMAGMALLGISGWFITATGLAGLAGPAFIMNVFLPSAAIRLLALARTFGRYGERLTTHDATLAVVASLREQLFRAWTTPAAGRALLRRPARVLFRLTGDIDALETVYLRLLVPACAAAGAALLAGAVLGAFNVWLGLALLAWLLVAGIGLTALVALRGRPLAVRRARAIERLREGAIDLVAGQTDLLMAGRLQPQCDAVMAREAALAGIDASVHRLDTRAGWAYAAAGHIGVAAVMLGASWLVQTGAIAAPAAALAMLMALSALEPFAAIRRGAIEAGRCALAARRVAPRLRQGAASPPPAVPAAGEMVRLEGVALTHPGRQAASLSDISVCIAEGEKVAVIGPSGAGKSTLLAVVAGEMTAQAGQVASRPCCWLNQRVALFQDSLRDNLRLGCPDATDAQLWHAVAAAGLDIEIRQLAQGLDSRLGEGGLGLSGGQARRLALARLLLRDVDFWLLDEPTEALDAATATDVLARLARHAAGRTVLLACHRRREAELADRILIMQSGRIVADVRRGTPAFAAALMTLRAD